MDEHPDGELYAAVYEPLLGTRVSVRLRAADEFIAGEAEARIIGEMNRLEGVLSAYRPGSEWSRWRRGEVPHPGEEITALLALAVHWHVVSGGAFHPLVGVLRARWLRAVDEHHAPSPDEMSALAATIGELPYTVADGRVEQLGDCSRLDLHALAKGWIIDRAAALVVGTSGTTEVLVNAGGDLLHRGPHPINVGIEDPRTPFDNAPPLTRVVLRDGGLASSSGSRRPMEVAGERYTHVLDPRTGWPVQHVLAATAIAPDAATADVMATITGVLPIDEGLRVADGRHGVACLLLDAGGATHTSARWPHDP